MNILFVNAMHGWAGIKTWTTELGAFLARRGHAVDVVCRPGNAMRPVCERLGLPCHEVRFGPDFSPRTLGRFVRLLRRLRTDVVVTNLSKEIRTAGVAARVLRIAHVNRLGSDRDIRDSIRTRIVYDVAVDRVLVPSRGLLDHYRTFPFLREKLCQFPNAVIPQPWRAARSEPLRFAVLARLSRRKQVDRIISAFSRIDYLPWELHIGGYGPELPTLRRLASSLGLADRIHFLCADTQTPLRIDPHAFLHDKDVGILYSSREAFGWAILEYLAASCAVVASAVDGPLEIIRDGVDGLLVDPSSTEALSTALGRLIASPELRDQLAWNGYTRVCQSFHQERIFPNVEAMLLQVVAERGLRQPVPPRYS